MSFLRIAHRGGAALEPENTLAAFADAMARGADGAELDVQLTRDAHAIVFHDFRLKPEICRDAQGEWLARPTPRIIDLTLAELESFDVGAADPASGYARDHPLQKLRDGERIPLLAEVVELARHAIRPFQLFVELKSSFADPALSATPELLAETAFAVLAEADFIGRTVFVGFDWRALLRIKGLAPSARCWFTTLPQSWFRDDVPPPEDDPPAPPALAMLKHLAATGASPWAAGFDAMRFGGSIIEAIRAAGGDGWFPYFRDATAEQITLAHRLGLKVGAWTVDDADEMRTLAARAIDAICTDRTDLILQL